MEGCQRSRSETEELREALLVRGRELVAVELLREDPPMIIHAQVADLAPRVAAAIHAEVDVVALVPVLHVNDALEHQDLDSQRLTQRAREGLLGALARLHLAAGELPEEREDRARLPLGDQVAPVALDHSTDDSDLPSHRAHPQATFDRTRLHRARSL